MSTTLDTKQDEALPTRERICTVAAALFADRGYAGVSMRDIADGVGIKAASLYNHFDDKEQLYIAALTQGFAGRIAHIDAAIDTGGSAADRLRATVMALTEISAGDDVSRKLLHRELLDGDSDRLDHLTRTLFKPSFERMCGLFGELAPHKGDPARTTAYINALITGYFVLLPVLQSLDAGLPTNPDAIGRQIADVLIENMQREDM